MAGIGLEDGRGHDALIVWAADQDLQRISQGYRESVEIEVLPDRGHPGRRDVGEVDGGVVPGEVP